ncbi:hypothetical protein GXW83_24380 [Streptacidiphilus sp. PB12-B1b]|uniref:DUF6603 domain-containing protein n=1 Tax=Streptacidiphilus sp. PB12-B1b TaxID=2705012 RepID=UPI0015FB7F8F|nr:DUF6603 domain-containing protein [Streptacidiphilus sp. PB12-B1b]QMU78378.1 hypothetical protein GXW83_24380 [Streptacidiphilus sp. PB12-B1b]
MPLSVEQLLARFPEQDGQFVLTTEDWDVSELCTVLGLPAGELVLAGCTPDSSRLTISGTVETPAGPVALELRFRASADGRSVAGLAARIPMDVGVVDLGGRLGADLSGLPQAFLGELTELVVHYDFGTGSVVLLAQTGRLRLVLAPASAGRGLVALAGLTGAHGLLSDLPHIGEVLSAAGDAGVRGVEVLSVGTAGVGEAEARALNAAVADAAPEAGQWWPQLPDRALTPGLWLGVAWALLEQQGVWVTQPGPPDEFSWAPSFPGLTLPLAFGELHWPKLGLSWTSTGGGGGGGGGDWALRVSFDLSLDLGWLRLDLPGAGFDFCLPHLGEWGSVLRLPSLSLDIGGLPITFTVPDVPVDLPGFPGLPGPGVLTGWFDGAGVRLPDLLAWLDIGLPSLPDVFYPTLPRLGLRFDLRRGDLELTAVSDWLRIVLGALASGPDWGRIALLGISGLKALLPDLPFIGDLLPDLPDFALEGISLAFLDGVRIPWPAVEGLNSWIGSLDPGSWWPTWLSGSGGGSSGQGSSDWALPGFSLDLDWKFPQLDRGWSIPWPPTGTPPDLSWLEIPPVDLRPLVLSGFALTWPTAGETDWPAPSADWVLRLEFDASLDLGGGFQIGLPHLGFDVDLSDFTVHPRLPNLSFTLDFPPLPALTVDFSVPKPSLPPGQWPFALTASWSDEDGVSAADLASFLGLSGLAEGIPEVLLARLYSVDVHLDFTDWFLVVTGTTGVGAVQSAAWLFATHPADNPNRRKLMAVRGAVELRGSDLPASSETVQREFDLVMSGIHASYADQHWNRDEILRLNAYLGTLDPPGSVPLPAFLPVDLPRGIQVWGELKAGELLEVTLVYPDRDDLPGVLGVPGVLGGPPGASSETSLLGLALGAVRFEHARLGLGYGTVYLAVDASLALGPLTLQLLGLGFGIDKDFDARPILEGAALGWQRKAPPPAITIAGALSNLDLGPAYGLSLAGLGRIEIEKLWAFQVAGSWAANRAGWTSLFAYAELTSLKQGMFQGLFSIGPVLFTGVALGFGINSTVRIPTAADIGRFPLVKRLELNPGGGSGKEPLTPGEALNELSGPGGWVTPAQGQYWGAGGAQFTVYQFINARALVLIEAGGAGWKAMLAGSTTLDLPPTALEPLGRVTVDFVFAYDSALGRLSMDSVIAKGSYLLDKALALTGGVSLYVWGKAQPGIPKGFALTAGGYHPQFRAPVHYPNPARLGLLWERGPIVIKGQVYAALTDGAFMIGAGMAAVYEAKHSGISVRAWFSSHFDALVQWKPFYADISWGMSIGVSASVKVAFVRVKVSIEVGVDLQLWLPPMGGRARIKVWFVSFTLGFGADRKGAPPVPWEDFRIQLPPTRTAPDRIALPDATTGSSDARNAEPAGAPHLVPIDGCAITVSSGLPASKITVNGKVIAGSDRAAVSIRPMRLTGVTSVQRVSISYRGRPYDWQAADWTVTEVSEGMPRALWGAPLARPEQALTDAGLVPDCLTGVLIEIPEPDRGGFVGPVTSAALDVEGLPDGSMPLRDETTAGTSPVPDEDSVEVITSTLAATASTRTSVHQALRALGCAPHSDGPLDRYAVLAGTTLTDPPMLATTAAR